MERKEAIRSAYRMTGGNNFYDGIMITCSTLSGKAVCCLVWAMNKAENDAYLEEAMSGISGNVAGAALQRWHRVFCGRLQRDDGAGCGTGVTVGVLKTKSLSESPKMPELLDRGDRRAYYFGRRTAEKRIFVEQKVSII